MSESSRDVAGYRSRRDLRPTPEPSGRGADGPDLSRGRHPFFVIQQHDASSLHWDLRLEVDGVLKSWAVPKGPSTDPREKRLAIETEDHPLEYADFEGVIPEDEYGGGRVIVWDAGPYENLGRDDEGEEIPVAQALARGKTEAWLEGRKLRGGYAVVRRALGGKAGNWLLVKMDDDAADARRRPVSTEPESVLSGRTVQELASDGADEGDEPPRTEDP